MSACLPDMSVIRMKAGANCFRMAHRLGEKSFALISRIRWLKDNMNIKKSLVVGAVAGLAFVSANAAVETQTLNYGTLGVGASQDLAFTKFDPSQGLLDEVTLTLVSHDYAEVDVINFTSVNQSFSDASTVIPISVTALDGLATGATASYSVASGVVLPPPFSITSFPGSTVTKNDSADLGSGFSDYIGGGGQTFQVAVAVADGNYLGTGTPGAVAFGGNGSSYGTVEIDYDYTPSAVPEPAAYGALAGAGLLLVSLGSQLRRKNA
jgi:hypothetical protein